MPGLGAVEMGQNLDQIRRRIRRRCRRVRKLHGTGTVDRVIDMILAPLVMDAMSGRYGSTSDAADAVGEDLLEVLSRPPRRSRPTGG